jgi:hypothetical protein
VRAFLIGEGVIAMFGFRQKQHSEKKLGAIGGLFGFAMFAAAAGLMWWNESRTVNEAKAIAELAQNAKTVNSQTIDRSRDSKAVYLQGKLETDTGTMDEQFAVGGADVILVRRQVQMYQWDKRRKNKRDVWEQKWSGSRESGNSDHPNPEFPIESQTFSANDAHIGVYQIGSEEINEIDDSVESILPSEIPMAMSQQGWRVQDGRLYLGNGTPGSPEIGDVRVSFNVQRESEVSVAGSLQSNRVSPYLAKHGTYAFFIERGNVPLKELAQHKESANSMLAYLLRGASAVFMVLGLGMAFSGLVGFLSWIPLLGPMIEKAAFLVGAILGGVLASLIFLGAWLWAHPLAFVALLVVGSLAAIAFGMRKKNQPITQIPPPPPPGTVMPPPPPR